MAEFRVDECRSCHAGVIWAVSVQDRPMPVDADPAEGGTVRLEPRGDRQAPRAVVLSPHRAFGVAGLRWAHHATCPQGPKWKRRKTRGGDLAHRAARMKGNRRA